MTTMDQSGAKTVPDTVGRLFHEVHQGIREQVEGVDRDRLNWKPHPDANSVAVLIVHTLGSEREMIRAVRMLSTERDRPAEFKAEADAADLLALLDRADRDLDEHVEALTAADLTEMRPRVIGLRSRAWSGWFRTTATRESTWRRSS
jgi:hypothetical protein